jgi:hypothetical protein
MPVLDFQHLKQRLAWAFPDDPVLGKPDLSTQPSPMPLIVGAPQSGTTLLRLTLDAHPELAMTAETGVLPSIVARPTSAGPLTPLELHRLVTRARQWGDVALDEHAVLAELTSLHPFSVSDGLRAVYRLYARQHGKVHWGDTISTNLERLHAVAQILPEIHVIHIVRDGRDAAHSLRDIGSAPIRDLQAQGRFWSECVGQARRAAQRNLHYLEIRYEDLVHTADRVLHQVCDFVGLAFDPRMSRCLPRTGDPVGRWRTEMMSEERAAFESTAGDTLDVLGYR